MFVCLLVCSSVRTSSSTQSSLSLVFEPRSLPHLVQVHTFVGALHLARFVDRASSRPSLVKLVQSVRGLFVCSCSSEDAFGPLWAFGWSTCVELLPVPVPRVQPADLQQWQSQHPALAWSLLLPLRLCVSLWACFHVLLSTTSHLGSRILPWRLLGPSQVCCLPLCMIVWFSPRTGGPKRQGAGQLKDTSAAAAGQVPFVLAPVC